MKNDYLWDRSGQDPEIERLEKSLETLRYRPRTPPIVPVAATQVSAFEKFWLALNRAWPAFAASALFLVAAASAGNWMRSGPGRLPVAHDSIFERPAPSLADLPNRPQLKPNDDPVPVNFGKQSLFTPIPKATRIAFRPASRRPLPDERIRLTPDERRAYNQLMLALAITGSKLKEIKDKVNGTDDLSAERNTIK